MKHTLTAPAFIEPHNPHLVPFKHEWNDDDPEYAYVTFGLKIEKKIHSISYRGELALACGIAEWIAWRFYQHGDITMVLKKVEAVWASMVDWRYLGDHPLPRMAECKGLVDGPLWSAAHWLNRVTELLQRGVPPSHEVVNFGRLFELLNTKPTAYKRWRDNAIERLNTYYPRQAPDFLGLPIPRQILDDAPYDPAAAIDQIHAFLQGLDPATNPYLSTSEQMLAAGFTGTPYT